MQSDLIPAGGIAPEGADPARIIRDHFIRELRSFVDELVGGTNKYRQLYSLSEQIPHDYHDRFLVELIQNANDASEPGREVRIVLEEGSDDVESRLYVANRGRPFSESNFTAICGLGVSDKDPEKAIGNKGLGFRSVLQVCAVPRVWSDHPLRGERSEDRFNGFCFEFTPLVREDIVAVLTEEIASSDPGIVEHPVLERMGFHGTLIEEPIRLERLRDRVARGALSVEDEAGYLSPYSFPLAITEADASPIVHELKRAGFVTVIELALLAAADVEAAKRAIGEISAEYLLFSTNLSRITVEHRHPAGSDLSRRFEKRAIQETEHRRAVPPAPLSSVEIVSLPAASDRALESNTSGEAAISQDWFHESRIWWLHNGELQGEELRAAAAKLPHRWHEVTSISVTVAIERHTLEPPEGRFAIFLPTHKKTGSPVWVNAPFYGNLARTEIALGEPYNELIFNRAVGLTIEMISAACAAPGRAADMVTIDLLDHRSVSAEFVAALDEQLSARGTPLDQVAAVPLYRADSVGSTTLIPIAGTRLPPALDAVTVLTPKRLARAGASVPAAAVLELRLEAVKRIADRANVDLKPRVEELAAWVEGIADQLRIDLVEPTVWNAFYEEVALLPSQPNLRNALRDRRFLWTEDGQLLSANDSSIKLFAYPGLGSTLEDDPDEVDVTEGTTDSRADIPPAIRRSVSFLSRDVRLLSEGQQRKFNQVGTFLRQGTPLFVPKFATQSIVNSVLVPLVKQSADNSDDRTREAVLAQALGWSFELYRSARTRARFDRIQWSELYVPTREGWTRADRAYFGAEWVSTTGALLEGAFPAGHQALKRLLVPPAVFAQRIGRGDEFATEEYELWIDFLRDQLRVGTAPHPLVSSYSRTVGEVQQAHLSMEGYWYRYEPKKLSNYFELPAPVWEAFTAHVRDEIRAPVQARETYFLDQQVDLEGLGEVTLETASPFAQLVFSRGEQIEQYLATKIRRWNGTEVPGNVPSTLLVALRESKWLPYKYDESSEQPAGMCRPRDAWLVPADRLRSPLQRIRYSFIRHLPSEVAAAVGSSSEEFRKKIGLRKVDVESWEDGVALLAHLSDFARGATVIERAREFGELWRETMVTTARAWEKADLDADVLRTAAGEAGWDGAWSIRANRLVWHPLSDLSDRGELFLPDDRLLRASLADWLPIADVREDALDAQISLLRDAFGPRVVSLSKLRLIPESEAADLNALADQAPLLTTVAPWLIPFVLTVFAFGRASRDVSLNSQRFQSLVGRTKELGFLSVEMLRLRVEGSGRTMPSLSPPSHLWQRGEKNPVLLVDASQARITALVHAIQTFFEVSDIEHPLYRALDHLGVDLGGSSPPEEAQRAALAQLHIAADEIDRVRTAIVGGDAEWVRDRTLVILAALDGIDDEPGATELRELVPGVAGSSGTGLLDHVDPERLRALAPDRIIQLARSEHTWHDLAEVLWQEARVTLAQWNAAISAMGLGYPVRNDDISAEFADLRRRLRPFFLTVIRAALRRSGRREEYIEVKRRFDGAPGLDSWADEHWELPLPEVLAYLRRSFESLFGELDAELSVMLTEAAPDIGTLEQRAVDAGLHPDHDDEVMERTNREMVGRLRDGATEAILQRWTESVPANTAPPAAFTRAVDDEALFSEAVRSRCQLDQLHLDEARGIVVAHLRETGVGDTIGISLAELIDELDWQAFSHHAASSDPTSMLEGLRNLAERAARTETILGRSYLPPGERFTGLDKLIDEAVAPGFSHGLDLTQRSPLVPVPPLSKKPGTRSPRRPTGRLSASKRALIGAVGEYLFYKALSEHPQLGPEGARDAWRSKNREHFFLETGSDDLGYDFDYTLDGVRYLVEVKAGGGGDFVDLSDNEAQQAKQHAGKRKSRTKYVIAVVRDPITDPRIFLLGNPFDRRDGTEMQVLETGARVYFKLG
jgi:hypothetical protein